MRNTPSASRECNIYVRICACEMTYLNDNRHSNSVILYPNNMESNHSLTEISVGANNNDKLEGTCSAAADNDDPDDRRLLRKLDLHLIPGMTLL